MVAGFLPLVVAAMVPVVATTTAPVTPPIRPPIAAPTAVPPPILVPPFPVAGQHDGGYGPVAKMKSGMKQAIARSCPAKLLAQFRIMGPRPAG